MKSSPNPFLLIALVAAAITVRPSSLLLAQGSLTPPGAPAPTMKTLNQIEPRKEVNAMNTPGDSASVFTITVPGSYYLSGNILGAPGKSGIRIAADDVSLDLNGFELKGVVGAVSGILFNGSEKNCFIRNGTIREWDGIGINGSSGVFSIFENLRCHKNGGIGLNIGSGSVVRSCITSENAGHGIRCLSISGGTDSKVVVIDRCLATNNGGDGFLLTNATVNDCAAEFNGGNGIANSFLVGETLTATNCTAISNTGDGIAAGSGSTLTDCTAKGNDGTHGIFAGSGSTLAGCTARENDVEFGIRAEERSTLSHCTASLNTSDAAESWGISTGPQCNISHCSVNGMLNMNATSTGTTGGGIVAGNGSTIQSCTVAGNKGDGIQIPGDCRVTGNTCDSSGIGGGNAAGIHSIGADNRIDDNNVTDSARGIDVDSTGSLIVRNSASGNTSNYEIAAGNAVGGIVSAPASIAISGSTGGAGVGSADPWANFSY